MNRIVPWATCLLLCGLVWLQHNTISDQKEKLGTMAQELKDERAKVSRIQKEAGKVSTKAQTDRLKVKEVLDATPAFRDTPVPEPVRTGLCSVVRCK